jgi:hypothetical protein
MIQFEQMAYTAAIQAGRMGERWQAGAVRARSGTPYRSLDAAIGLVQAGLVRLVAGDDDLCLRRCAGLGTRRPRRDTLRRAMTSTGPT